MHNNFEQSDSSGQWRDSQCNSPVDLSNSHDVRQAFPSHRHHEFDHHSHCGSLDLGSNIYPEKHCPSDSPQAIEEELLAVCKTLQSLLDVVKARIDAMEHQLPVKDPVAPLPMTDAPTPVSQNPAPATDTQPPSTPITDNPTPDPVTDAPSTPTSGTPGGSLDQVLMQNDRNHATTYAEGDSSSNVLNASHNPGVPAGAKGFSGWGIITNQDGAQVDRSATAQVQNMQTYVHLKSGGWKLIENQNDSSNGSKLASMVENTNFTNLKQMNVDNNNGVASMAAPPGTYTMDHFGVANSSWTPGVFDQDSIDGVFVRADAKASKNDSGMIAKLGDEWWSNPQGKDNTILGVPGTSNFVKLTDQWQPMYFSSVDNATLEKDPPPGIGNDVTAGGTMTGDNHNSKTKLIIPFPTDAQWPEILQKAPEGSVTFSIYSGDNSKPDSFGQIGQNVAGDLANAKAKGLVPMGYVGTAAGTLPLDEAKRRVDLWMDAGAAGVYLGGSGKADGTGYATDPASEAYFDQLADYIHARGGKAFINGVYMSGGSTNPHYYGKMDGQGNHEGYMNDFDKQISTIASDPHPENEFVFVSGVNANDLNRVEKQLTDANVGYLWLTDVDYGSSPEYLSQEIALLS
ncbi:MAG: hypothetical protein JST01_16475 [Cyanobacteria bacterium SZAS TMP-1]|nr:hypothetical protein [Cyanobacteria bacterium SZAS TMP-1]